jgi:hypothetical protein
VSYRSDAKRSFSKDSGRFIGMASLAAEFKAALPSDHLYTARILVSKKDSTIALSDFSEKGRGVVYRLHDLIEMTFDVV